LSGDSGSGIVHFLIELMPNMYTRQCWLDKLSFAHFAFTVASYASLASFLLTLPRRLMFQHFLPAGKSAGGRTTLTTQSSITTPSIAPNEVVDDRKALRDMLYQGIWVRHRRTIFSVGSFLRMLKSKNSHNYNTIRSTSENEDEPR
jgi:hypothetical protein